MDHALEEGKIGKPQIYIYQIIVILLLDIKQQVQVFRLSTIVKVQQNLPRISKLTNGLAEPNKATNSK